MADTQSETGGSARGRSNRARKRVLDQIDIWRKELINLARNNRLLYFKHTRSSTLEIIREPDQANGVVQRLLAGGGWSFFFPPEQEQSEEGDELLPAPVVPPVPGPDELITSKEEAPALRNSLTPRDERAHQRGSRSR